MALSTIPNSPPASRPTSCGNNRTVTVIPAIVVSGEVDDPNAAEILIEYRPTGAIEWINWGSFAKNTRQIEITAVTRNTAYDVAVSYKTGLGVTSDRLILGATAGEQEIEWGGGVIVGESKPKDYADNTEDALDASRFFLARKEDRIGVETRTRFDPMFWTCNFPLTMMAAVTQTAPDALELNAVFHERGHLAGLIWESADLLDHPTTSYDTNRDYRGCKLSFRLKIEGEAQNLAGDNGPVLTVEGRDAQGQPRTWYVRLGYCMTEGSPSDAQIELDFDALEGGFYGGDAVFAGDIDRMFISCVPSNFQDGSSSRLVSPSEAKMTLSGITVTGENRSLICGIGPGGVHRLRMSNGYDDTYNVTPRRIVRNCQLLGYRGEFNHYVGMSHYFNWRWNGAGNRYIAVDEAQPLNQPCVEWHRDLAARLKFADMQLILSISYEMLNSFTPANWRQLDHDGQPALTGWEPPSALLSPCNAEAMNYLRKVGVQFADIASEAGLPIHFQVGEPWYWIDFRTFKPYFYDPYTTAAYFDETGRTAPAITTMTAEMDSEQIDYLNWLGNRLGASVLTLLDGVRTAYSQMRSYALIYLPQLLNEATPEAHRVNLPLNLAYPALDVLQVEDYDFVIDNRPDLSATGRAKVERELGYPRSAQHYFAGFALNRDVGPIWRRTSRAAAAAYEWGVDPVFIWAYTQIMRDGYVPTIKSTPAIGLSDAKDVRLAQGAAANDVLNYDAVAGAWKPGKPWEAAIQTALSSPQVHVPQLAQPWTSYGDGYVEARYYRTADGSVCLEGAIRADGAFENGMILFNLPIGYRPQGTQTFVVETGTGFGRIKVDAAGDVQLVDVRAEFTSLSGVRFLATI